MSFVGINFLIIHLVCMPDIMKKKVKVGYVKNVLKTLVICSAGKQQKNKMKSSKEVLNTTHSASKRGIYSMKITNIKKEIAKK